MSGKAIDAGVVGLPEAKSVRWSHVMPGMLRGRFPAAKSTRTTRKAEATGNPEETGSATKMVPCSTGGVPIRDTESMPGRPGTSGRATASRSTIFLKGSSRVSMCTAMDAGWIMLLEDDALSDRRIRQACVGAGIETEIRSCAEAADALPTLQRSSQLPVLLLLSHEHGAIRGLDFLAQLRRRSEFDGLPAFLLAQDLTCEDVALGLRLGVIHFLQRTRDMHAAIHEMRVVGNYLERKLGVRSAA
ncbi:MAG: hypothetical protein V3V08_16655 [Nannocystaceae bacterium]